MEGFTRDDPPGWIVKRIIPLSTMKKIALAVEIFAVLLVLAGGLSCQRDTSPVMVNEPSPDFWQAAQGPYGGHISAIGESDEGHLFAATLGSGVFRSTDGGSTWMPLNRGLTSHMIHALIPYSRSLPVIGTDDGVFMLEDGEWRPMGLQGRGVYALAVDPQGRLYAGTFRSGIFRTADAGRTWEFLTFGGLPEVTALLLPPTGPWFAGSRRRGVLRSEDGGEHWEPVNRGLPDSTVHALFRLRQGEILAGTDQGVYRSSDAGETWEFVGPGEAPVYALLQDLGGSIWIGTEEGAFRSFDLGDHWEAVHVGAEGMAVVSILESETAGVLLGFAGNGLYRRVGDAWEQVGVSVSTVLSLSPAGEELLAGTSGGGLFRSTDAGRHWFPGGLSGETVRAVTVGFRGFWFIGTLEGKLYRSGDQGRGWEELSPGIPVNAIYALVINRFDHLFAASDQGILRSTDEGGSWRRFDAGLAPYVPQTLAVDEQNFLYVGTAGGGVLMSNDNGETWAPTGLANNSIRCLALRSGGEVYAGSLFGEIFYSRDRGAHWERIDRGLLHTPVNALAVGLSGEVYAGSGGEGVIVSTDRGESWQFLNRGLENRRVISLLVVPEGTVYAGTLGSGVFVGKGQR